MRPLVLTIAVAALLAAALPAWADPDKDESGKGRGGPPPWAGRGDKDQKEYLKKLEEQQREAAKRFEEQQREGRKRYEERLKDDEERRREAEKDYYKDLEKGRSYGPGAYPGPYEGERHSGYRGYTPPGLVRPYGGPVAPAASGLLPLLGDPGSYLTRPGGPDAPYSGNAYAPPAYQGGGYPVRPDGPYPGGPDAPYPGSAYPPPVSQGGYPAPPVGPYPGDEFLPPENYGPLPALPPSPAAPGPPPTGGQITALSEQLLGQADAFLQAFAPQAGTVPEGEAFMADVQALRDAAAHFREVAVGGAPPDQVAAEFAGVAAGWQRFEARTARVSKGRVGPNIATSLQMGETIQQIGRLLPDPRRFPGGEF